MKSAGGKVRIVAEKFFRTPQGAAARIFNNELSLSLRLLIDSAHEVGHA